VPDAPRVPPHLNHLVVEQDYAQYNAQDQAIWRFVVLQTHRKLLATAHSAYAKGFERAGISVERIPEIARMSDSLARIGWSAVCVDGFIPPRAFQAFQAASVLPIAGDIRTSRHLTYTPAPDIIHEAAGHAPFLADPGYAAFLRRIGEVGRRAFSSPYDRALYEAIHALSEVKEDPNASARERNAAERVFQRLSRHAEAPSEAALVARLYWWTVEYGLVGSLRAPRLYGAGLLSSIGEGHFCLGREVEKRPLTRDCIEVAYDITRAQPQLFVAPSFDRLLEVLDDVAGGLSQCVGGSHGLATARASGEAATFTLDSGAQVTGVVSGVREAHGEPWLVELSGPCAVAEDHVLLGRLGRASGYLLPLGALRDGTPLSRVDLARVAAMRDGHGRVVLQTRHGVRVSGVPITSVTRAGRVRFLVLADCEIRAPGREPYRAREPLPVALGARVVSAAAGAPTGLEAPTAPAGTRVPKARQFSPRDQALITLYDRALTAFASRDARAMEGTCADIVARLDARHRDDWLLRWNLLESLIKAQAASRLRAKLATDLARMEKRYRGLEPIATGLGYLREYQRDVLGRTRPARRVRTRRSA
jgi:phenylalanine-4-hydroxylase